MLCRRLHANLLRRYPSRCIPGASLLLTCSSTSTLTNNGCRHHSPRFPHPAAASGSKGTRLSGHPRLRHPPEKKKNRTFCTTETDALKSHPEPSNSSSYRSVRIHCSKDDAILLSEALLCFGASSASMDELSGYEALDEICITSIFTDADDVHACILSAANSIGLKCMPNYTVLKGEQCDWLTKVQENFRPIEVTDGLWIVPSWRTPPVSDSEATNIILNPGLAFGTGEHPTTKLCLLLLKHLVKGGESFLDYGTGSGILGIAAVKMGAASSVGIDIDPQAVASARQNITLNEIDSHMMSVYLVPSNIHLLSMDGANCANEGKQVLYGLYLNNEMGKFDIIIANLLLNPLIELVSHITAFGKAGAVIGVSGILSNQVQQVKECYSEYLRDITVSEMDGWACLHGIKKRK